MSHERADRQPNGHDPYDDVVDPDFDRHEPPGAPIREWRVLLAIGAGGSGGALARYGIDHAFPTAAAGFPWATLIVNVSGCLLIGVTMVVLLELYAAHPLARPFLATGVLGGYTTFSTYTTDIQQLLVAHRWQIAFGYLLTTVVLCLLATWLATSTTRRLAGPRPASATTPRVPQAR
jgi:fluoride exporter